MHFTKILGISQSQLLFSWRSMNTLCCKKGLFYKYIFLALLLIFLLAYSIIIADLIYMRVSRNNYIV